MMRPTLEPGMLRVHGVQVPNPAKAATLEVSSPFSVLSTAEDASWRSAQSLLSGDASSSGARGTGGMPSSACSNAATALASPTASAAYAAAAGMSPRQSEDANLLLAALAGPIEKISPQPDDVRQRAGNVLRGCREPESGVRVHGGRIFARFSGMHGGRSARSMGTGSARSSASSFDEIIGLQ